MNFNGIGAMASRGSQDNLTGCGFSASPCHSKAAEATRLHRRGPKGGPGETVHDTQSGFLVAIAPRTTVVVPVATAGALLSNRMGVSGSSCPAASTNRALSRIESPRLTTVGDTSRTDVTRLASDGNWQLAAHIPAARAAVRNGRRVGMARGKGYGKGGRAKGV